MNDVKQLAGELARPQPSGSTVLDTVGGSSSGSLPVIRPVAASAAGSGANTSPMTLLRALKRRLALALGLAIVVSGIASTAAWFLLPPPLFKPVARLLVSSQAPNVVFRTSEAVESGDSYRRYQRTQLSLLKGRLVLNTVLQQPEIKNLRIIQEHIDDPFDWLMKNTIAQFPQESEVLEISVGGEDAIEAAKLVNAITRAYFDEVVNQDQKRRQERLEALKKWSKTYADMMRTRRETLRKLAQQAGSDDRQTLVLKQQYAMDHVAGVRRELQEVQAQRRKMESILKVQRPGGLQETSAPLVTSSEVERLIDQDPDISSLMDRLAGMEQRLESERAHTGRVARKLSMDPGLKALREEVDALRKQLRKRREAIRPAVVRHLENPQAAPEPGKGGDLRQQLAVAADLEKTLQNELDKLTQTDQRLTSNTLDVQDLQGELKQTQDSAEKINREIEMLNVEIQAPPRIRLVEEATPPASRDSKRWYSLFAMIALGSFLGTMFAVAFLEVQSRKVDSADEVVADLGLPVVGSLPMLPARTRKNGLAAHREKDRYWYQLLLESIDATRTMLVHAAHTGAHRVVMITSALPGEGKTSLASHLATSLARSGQRTILIDADLRSPSIHRLFELGPDPGVSELLRNEIRLDDVIASTSVAELKVITAGACDHQTLRILAQGGMGGIFAQLKEQFDFVIVDSSPILPVADALNIAQQVDAVLLSVLTDVSRKTKIFAAQQRLETLGVRVLGAVVTGAHDGVYGAHYYPGNVGAGGAQAETETEIQTEPSDTEAAS